MRVGFRDLTLWSFLMASAHGAGLMLVPVFLETMLAKGVHAAHSRRGCSAPGYGYSVAEELLDFVNPFPRAEEIVAPL